MTSTIGDGVAPRRRRRPLSMAVRVTRVERLSASMVRVAFGGVDLARFPAAEYADSHVKPVFEHPDAEGMRPLDLDRAAEVLRHLRVDRAVPADRLSIRPTSRRTRAP